MALLPRAAGRNRTAERQRAASRRLRPELPPAHRHEVRLLRDQGLPLQCRIGMRYSNEFCFGTPARLVDNGGDPSRVTAGGSRGRYGGRMEGANQAPGWVFQLRSDSGGSGGRNSGGAILSRAELSPRRTANGCSWTRREQCRAYSLTMLNGRSTIESACRRTAPRPRSDNPFLPDSAPRWKRTRCPRF